MHSFLQDLRYAGRNFLKAKGFTAIAGATLAIGIGANTAIFSLVDSVLLRPLPFREPGQLVRLYETEAAPGNYPFALPDFLDWKGQNHTFQDMALFGFLSDFNLSGEGQSQHVLGSYTETNFFSLLGVNALLGRTWAPGEGQPGHNRVAILSYGLWQSRYAADAKVIGRTIDLNSQKFTIIGVMPAHFRYPVRSQVWLPLLMDPALNPRGSHWASAMGRLKPGVSPQAAQSDLAAIAARLEQLYPGSNYKVGAVTVALHQDLVGDGRGPLLVMLSAVGVVLLIACANVANLLLSRGVARQREIAIRSALGAARARLIRQMLTESVLLAVTGGALGLLLAYGVVAGFARVNSAALPQFSLVQVNTGVLAFTFVLSLLTGLLFGMMPAWQVSRPGLSEELKGGAGSVVSPSRRRRFATNALVAAEIALSVLLVVCAGLLLKDFVRLRATDIGVRAGGVWTAAIQLPNASYPDRPRQFQFAQALLAKLRNLPGVDGAALSTRLPLEGGSNSFIKLRGVASPPMSGPLVENHAATIDYFRAMGIPLLRGRPFTEEDVERTSSLNARLRQLRKPGAQGPPPEAEAMIFPTIVNETMARHFWPNRNPVGQLFSVGSDRGPWRQVIGVVGDVKQMGVVEDVRPEAYDAFDGSSRLLLVLHTSRNPRSLTSPVRQDLTQLDTALPLYLVRTLDDIIADHTQGQQFLSFLVGSFAALAALLAAIGIYGVLSYAVTQRTREIGIRMSLGATRGRVLGEVLRDGMGIVLIGFAAGVLGALAAGRVLATLLHDVKPTDPATFVMAGLLLTLTALAACYWPARRAANLDPTVALRYE
ncbi:MAG TPA: ABC transporter permease [Bryobacteraceae bacterium]